MILQDTMFLAYLVYLHEEEPDEEVRKEKILKAVDDYMLGRKK